MHFVFFWFFFFQVCVELWVLPRRGKAPVTGHRLGCFLWARDEGALCGCGVSNEWMSRFAFPPMCSADFCWLAHVLLFLALSVLIINRIPMKWPLVQLSQESSNCDSTSSTTFNSFLAFSVIMGTVKSFPSQLHTVVPEKPLLFPILNIGNICAYICRVTVSKCWLLNGMLRHSRARCCPEWFSCGVAVVASEVMQEGAGWDSNSGCAYLRTKYVKTEILSRVSNENWSFISLQAIL